MDGVPEIHPDYAGICRRALAWARSRDYTGYDKHDALNSPLLRAISRPSKFLRMGLSFAVSRSPVNLRPLLMVRPGQNPKGLALFAEACLTLGRATGDEALSAEGLRLLTVLRGLSAGKGRSGHCWGYDHPWENGRFYVPAREPNAVVTCFVAGAFLKAYELTGDELHLSVARSAGEFILNDLRWTDVGEGLACCSYDLRSGFRVINVSAIAAGLLARLHRLTGDERCLARSAAAMRWVVSRQTDYHAWHYADPPGDSHVRHDNYHMGFILDAILACHQAGVGFGLLQTHRDGLEFYREHLFTAEGAPKWRSDRAFPHDAHGSAQGVITFCRAAEVDASNLQFARRVLDWALANLYVPGAGRFRYQVARFGRKGYTLMRWSQAWMCRALAEFVERQGYRE